LSKKGISKENLIEASVEEMQNKGFFMQLKGVKFFHHSFSNAFVNHKTFELFLTENKRENGRNRRKGIK
jgi:hypothetical protein